MDIVEKLTAFGKAMVVDDKYIVTRSGDVYSYWENHKKWKKQKLRENTNGYLRANIHGSDFFGGSGSTLIACEQLNRNCFMMELDPKFVDVIIARWEKFTGQKAVLLNG